MSARRNNGEPTKRNRTTAVSIFHRDSRSSNPAFRSLPCWHPDVMRAFDSLSLEERQRYERKAKEENRKFDNKFADKFRRDCEGVPLEERNASAKMAQDYQDWCNKLLTQMVANADTEWLLDKPFVVGELFDYLPPDPREGRANVPAEFGFVRFTLRSGVTDCLHHIVTLTSPIPTHLRYESRDHSEQTHNIPMDFKSDQSVQTFDRKLRSLCQDADGNPLPLFAPADSVEKMQHGLLYIYNPSNALGPCPLVQEVSKPGKTRILSFEALICRLLDCPGVPEGQRIKMIAGQISIEMNSFRFTGYGECCQLHNEQDNTKFCALTRAHCYAWTAFDLICSRLGVAPTRAHGPSDSQLPAPRAVKMLDKPGNTRGLRQAAPAAAMATVSPTPPSESADAAAPSSGFGRGFGRGRGRGIRPTSPQQLPSPPSLCQQDEGDDTLSPTVADSSRASPWQQPKQRGAGYRGNGNDGPPVSTSPWQQQRQQGAGYQVNGNDGPPVRNSPWQQQRQEATGYQVNGNDEPPARTSPRQQEANVPAYNAVARAPAGRGRGLSPAPTPQPPPPPGLWIDDQPAPPPSAGRGRGRGRNRVGGIQDLVIID